MPILRIPVLAGMDERPNASADSAREIRGMRWDASEARWASDRGFRSYTPSAPSRGATGHVPVVSMAFHGTLGDATKDIYLETVDADGQHTTLSRLSPFASDALTQIQALRHLPGTEEPSTCFASAGEICIAVNGHDAPLRIYPMTSTQIRAETFGFPLRPPAPQPHEISSSSMRASATAYYYAKSVEVSDVTVAFPTSNVLGLGTPTTNATNTYLYKYTWVTDTGSESPMSAASPALVWQTCSSEAYRYGCLVTGIAMGPPGTVKRRVYRTRNMGDTQLISSPTYYFLGDIPNNYETVFTDQSPDSMLGSEAPTDLNSYMLPSDIRWVTTHAGRVWLVASDFRVHWSEAGQVESFGAASYVDVMGRRGGRVTGLVSYNDLLLILRETAIEAVVQSGSTFRAVPVLENIGTKAPHAAITVPGVGVVFVSDDGIYALRGTFSGGSSISVQELTQTIDWSRVNTAALAKAWAWTNSRDREVVFALPVDSSTLPSRHLVMHLDGVPPGGHGVAWSMREIDFAASGIVGPEGWPYMGGSGSSSSKPALIGVWAAYDQYGYDPNASGYEPLARPDAYWESADLDLSGNADQTKVARYVTASVSSYGDSPVYLDCFFDGGWESQGTTQTSPTHTLDRKNVPVYETSIVGTTVYSKRGVSEIRFDLNNYQFRRVRFRFRSASIFAIYGFAVHFDEQGPALPFSPVQRNTSFGKPNAPSTNVPASKLPGGIK